MKVYAKHEPYWETGHLGSVIAHMRVAGRPNIKVIEFDREYYALNGSHRLAAAYYLGFTPKFEIQKGDCSNLCDKFWIKVRMSLPFYEFEITEKDK